MVPIAWGGLQVDLFKFLDEASRLRLAKALKTIGVSHQAPPSAPACFNSTQLLATAVAHWTIHN